MKEEDVQDMIFYYQYCLFISLTLNKAVLNAVAFQKQPFQRCSYKTLFWKYAANLQENAHAEVWFQQSFNATLLISQFDMDVLL